MSFFFIARSKLLKHFFQNNSSRANKKTTTAKKTKRESREDAFLVEGFWLRWYSDSESAHAIMFMCITETTIFFFKYMVAFRIYIK
jgi:hypothetical protein